MIIKVRTVVVSESGKEEIGYNHEGKIRGIKVFYIYLDEG